MKLLKRLVPLFVVLAFSLHGESNRPFINNTCDKGDVSRFDNALSEKDWDELYDYINTKRTINLFEKSHNLTIAGDVRVDWRNWSEKNRGDSVRGGGNVDADGIRLSRNDFDIEFNLYFDYVCGRAWAVAQIEFDNTAGAFYNDYGCVEDPEGFHGSGFNCDICLKKAYMGYNICCSNDIRFDVELGRRHLYHVFDSEVQFLSRFDGLLLRYSGCWCNRLDYYACLGGFVVDERSNHFGWVTELGFLNICNCGFDFKYSFIDWRKCGHNRCDVSDPIGCKFMVSQWTVKYHFFAEMLRVPAYAYGAFLWNHDAARSSFTDDKKADKAGYVGFRIGEVCECGDYAFDLQYQYVQAQSIPDFDVSGIGRGNFNDDHLTINSRGNTNYQGWRVEALYAFTDNLIIDARVEASHSIDDDIGGRHRYSQFRVEAIYAF